MSLCAENINTPTSFFESLFEVSPFTIGCYLEKHRDQRYPPCFRHPHNPAVYAEFILVSGEIKCFWFLCDSDSSLVVIDVRDAYEEELDFLDDLEDDFYYHVLCENGEVDHEKVLLQ